MGLSMGIEAKNWTYVAITDSNLGDAELLYGEVAAAVVTAEQGSLMRTQSGRRISNLLGVPTAPLPCTLRKREEAERFRDAERGREWQPNTKLLFRFKLQYAIYCRRGPDETSYSKG